MAFSSHYNLSNDFRIELSNPMVGDLAMWYGGELSFPSFHHEEASVPNIMQVPECNHMVESPESMTLFSKYRDISDMGLRTCFSSITGSECSQYNQLLEGEQCSGQLVSNFWPIYPPIINDSFNETNEKSAKGLEETTMKAGKCSVEERKDKIMKYLRKRNQRNFNKTIKYACRKTLADKRVRVRGRFAKNNEPCEYVEEEVPMKNYYQIPHCEETTQSFNGICVQMKKDYEEVEEDWLEEAMATLMYSPSLYIHGYDDHSIHS